MVAGTSTLFYCPENATVNDKNFLTILKILSIIILEQLFGYRLSWKGIKRMFNENEEEFMKIIRENDKPEQAAVIAIKVFAAFLARLEADQELQPVCLRESS